MAEAQLDLDVYGVHLHLEGDAEAIDGLRVQLGAFAAAFDSGAVFIGLRRSAPALPAGRLVASQVLERGVVYNDGAVTLVDHHGKALSRYDFSLDRGEVTAPEPADLIELGYLMAQARIGAKLEALGLVRVHGLGVVAHGRAALVLLPSGGGKSRLALALLERAEARLLGDDVVVLDRTGRAHPFPTPLGIGRPEQGAAFGRVRPFERRLHGRKYVLELEGLMPRFATGAHRVDLVAVATRVSAGPSRLVPAPRRVVAGALFRDAVVGLGLPQVLELVARRGARDLWAQTPKLLSRSRAALAVLARARTACLEIADPGEAAGVLLEALQQGA